MKAPKEFAEEIFEKYMSEINEFVGGQEMHTHSVAKQCALIAVDQIIEALDVFNYTNTWYDDYYTGKMILTEDKDPSDYWKEVRKHIETL
jgi:hypothetical protein